MGELNLAGTVSSVGEIVGTVSSENFQYYGIIGEQRLDDIPNGVIYSRGQVSLKYDGMKGEEVLPISEGAYIVKNTIKNGDDRCTLYVYERNKLTDVDGATGRVFVTKLVPSTLDNKIYYQVIEEHSGVDGFSPTVLIEPHPTGNGTIVTITDKNGAQSFEVMNGTGGGGTVSVQEIYGDWNILGLPVGLSYASEYTLLHYLSDVENTLSDYLEVQKRSYIIKTVSKVEYTNWEGNLVVEDAVTIYVVPENQVETDHYGNKTYLVNQKIVPAPNSYGLQYTKIDTSVFVNNLTVVNSLKDITEPEYDNFHPNHVPSVGAVIDYVASAQLEGEDGVSPTVTVSESGKVTTIEITDKDGVKTATINDGEDGYTPQKGVDYFDGEDGYTPVKGVDYFDGEDGNDGTSITIKSVNESSDDGGNNVVTFSDGKTLTVKNGKGGADGISPTVAVSKSGKVTTIEITDKDGVKTATINDGEDGDPYTLTDADKQTIVDAVLDAQTTETWTFELEDGSTVEKSVVVS